MFAQRIPVAIATVFLWVVVFGRATAFHEKGVANCNACHTMHNSENGLPVDPGNPAGNQWLLKAETASDICLTCHADNNGTVFGSDPLNPPPERGAGNFVFLLEDNINDAPDGATNPIPGDAAGHSINAPAYGLMAVSIPATSPGGSFPSADLGCTSCHDPHGNSNFRMLHGDGPIAGPGSFTFTYPAPQAEGIALNTVESNGNHSAYRSGVSNWCANCHGQYHHNESNPQFHHPSQHRLESSIIRQYNQYNGTDDPTGGNVATAYLRFVPFEDATMTTTSTAGPSSSSYVMCLTCHRAHATSAPHAGRWDFNVSLLSQDGVVSGSYPIPDPYNSPNQTGLCYKCHKNGHD